MLTLTASGAQVPGLGEEKPTPLLPGEKLPKQTRHMTRFRQC